MSFPKRRPFALTLLCLTMVLGFTAAAYAAAEGDVLPALKLVNVASDATDDVATLVKGGVGAISYMQTSCAACRKELMALKDLQAKYPELKVVAISVDSGNPARVARYREHFGFEFPFLHDPDFKTPELFGFSFTPALVLVGKDGKIALLKGGYRPGDEVALDQTILELTSK